MGCGSSKFYRKGKWQAIQYVWDVWYDHGLLQSAQEKLKKAQEKLKDAINGDASYVASATNSNSSSAGKKYC